MRTVRRLLMLACVAGVGHVAGWTLASLRHVMPRPENYPFLVEEVPLPHHIPEFEGGLSFRFAMAHDVIFERFAKHGPAYYQERDQLIRAKLALLPADHPDRFPLLDDLATDSERLGRSADAVAVMREKLADQQAKGIAGRELYTSYANLGTFLIHASFARSLAGDPDAQGHFREGVEFVRKSVEVNPSAHFGRERWQARIAEFLLAAMADPDLLKRTDCLGNRLNLSMAEIVSFDSGDSSTGRGHPTDLTFRDEGASDAVPAYFRPEAPIDDPTHWAEFREIRKYIARVGSETPSAEADPSPRREPAPFDEPVLGIIGMWRQGGGSNPHFALALGETMLRVGQRFIAWEAFQRASLMADRFWPDPALQQSLRDHCRRRQGEIEAAILATPVPPGRPPNEANALASLRVNFEKEMAFGRQYQKDYQEYEANKIAGGASIADPHFFDEFDAARGDIASPTGPEEWLPWTPRARINAYAADQAQAWGIFGAGAAAMLLALGLRLGGRLTAARP